MPEKVCLTCKIAISLFLTKGNYIHRESFKIETQIQTDLPS